MEYHETHTVPKGIENLRIEHYACTVFDKLPTRKSVRKALKRDEIRIDGKACTPGFRICSGQILELINIERKNPKPFKIQLKIHYEDEWVAVIEKPPGIAVNGNRYRTVENALQFNLMQSTKRDALRWPRPAHRLDTPTGGLLIAAKTSASQVNLGRQFQHREVRKRYRAIVIGLLEGNGRINEPLDNRNAETEYQAIMHTQSLKSDWLTLVDLWPKTGRFHQLRRHLSKRGHPILGDKRYGIEGKILNSKGLFLWAVELSFRHPVHEWVLNIRINEAQKFNSFLKREKRRWEKYYS